MEAGTQLPGADTVSVPEMPENSDEDSLLGAVAEFLNDSSSGPADVPPAMEEMPRATVAATLGVLRSDSRINTYRRAVPVIHAFHGHARPEELEEIYKKALRVDVRVAGELVQYLDTEEHPTDRFVRDLLMIKSYRRLFRNGLRDVGLGEDMAHFEGILYEDGRPASPDTPRLILSLYFDYRHFFLGVGRRKHTAMVHRELADMLAGRLAPDALKPLVAALLPVEEMVQQPHRLWAFCRFAAELSMIELSRQLDGDLRDRFDEKLLTEALRLSDTFEADCILYEIGLGLSEQDFLDAVLARKKVNIARWIRLGRDGSRSYSDGSSEVSIHLRHHGGYGRFTKPLNRDGSQATLPEATLKVIREDAAFKERRLAFLTDRLQACLLRRFLTSSPVSFIGTIGTKGSPFVQYVVAGSLLLHQEGGSVFLYTKDGPITSDEDPYTVRPGVAIRLAHREEMTPEELSQWILYFRRHHLEPLIWQFGPMC